MHCGFRSSFIVVVAIFIEGCAMKVLDSDEVDSDADPTVHAEVDAELVEWAREQGGESKSAGLDFDLLNQEKDVGIVSEKNDSAAETARLETGPSESVADTQRLVTTPPPPNALDQGVVPDFFSGASMRSTSVGRVPPKRGHVLSQHINTRYVARPVPTPIPNAHQRPTRLDVVEDREEYTDYGIHPFNLTRVDAKSTFSIDVDTASYTMSRRKLKRGVLPAWEGVRIEEFVNYFDYGYSAPRRDPFSVHMEVMPDPFRHGSHILRVGLQAKRFRQSERPPLHLTFLVDVSGSMASPDKLGLAKESMHTLVSSLREGDTVALATYAGRVAEILRPTHISQSATIHRAIDSLQSGGSTAMSSGIDLAYQMADEAFEPGAENRVVILSDGDANVGATSFDAMLHQIKGHADQGITLSTIGFGQGNYRDTLMEQLANNGDGNNFYVDTQAESDRIFSEKIGATMITVARDTKIQVEFNERAVKSYRLIGYENRDIADEDFRNDRVDAGEVGSGHSVTALYEVKLARQFDDELATVRLRWEQPGQDGEATEKAFSFDSGRINRSVRDASPAIRLAYGAATFAEVLRQSPHASTVDLLVLQDMVGAVANDREGEELARLIGMADRLGAASPSLSWPSRH